MGNIKLVQKQDKLAAHYYQIVIDLKSPLAPAAKIYMSQAVDRMGNYKKAIRLLGEAIEENLSDALYNLAMDEIELYKQCRRMEKLIDELARGHKMEKTLRAE